MSAPLIKVAFASGTDELNRGLVRRLRDLYPELPVWIVSEFPPAQWDAGEHERWIPYHVSRSFAENLARCRAALAGRRVRLAGVLLVPRVPYRRLRLIALVLAPRGFLAFNEHFGSFMLRPASAGNIARHLIWRTGNLLRWQLNPGGPLYTRFWKLVRPSEWRLPAAWRLALFAGWRAARRKAALAPVTVMCGPSPAPGRSVVIPSRDGIDLLRRCLPGVLRDLEGTASEVIVVDNGSSDGTAAALAREFPAVRVEVSVPALSFARAVNRGLERVGFSHVCLLNNDMLVEPGFFAALALAFERVPDLFCATAQIFFPEGMRREETGKAVAARNHPQDFPVRCDPPVEGEDLTYVLYGSGGCSLYDTAKLRALGGVSEAYEPAYCEDLDLGWRGWLAGWPSVFVAGARVEHRHRATTSRYYTPAQLEAILEIHHLRFLCRAVASPAVFRRLWHEAIRRLLFLALEKSAAAWQALAAARAAPQWIEPPLAWTFSDDEVLAIGSGQASVFPGAEARGKPVVLVVSPYLPFPLSHGGAVRMFNLMRRAAADYDQVLVCFSPQLEAPAPELRAICREIVVVQHTGSHSRPSSPRPDVVEEFDSPAFRAVLRQTCRKWRPALVQLEFTQMAQYAAGCRPARTLLVEHDITLDLYEQLLRLDEDWEMRRQLERWRAFETAAWREVDCVVAMSEKDRGLVPGDRAVTLANGVDLDRFRPSEQEPERARILFIGSFAHLPNLLALQFFLRDIKPLVEDLGPTLHVIAGRRPEYFLDFYKNRVRVDLAQPGVELEAFVSDVRPAYRRAAAVIAPLVASAGTNIKIMEAMAMGKAIVSTPAGINGLDLAVGADVLVAEGPEAFAAALREVLSQAARRRSLEQNARATAESLYDWDRIAEQQSSLYRRLLTI